MPRRTKTLPTTAPIALVLVVLCALSCSRCQKKPEVVSEKPTELASLLDKQEDAVVYVPQLGRLGAHALQLSQLKLAGLGAQLAGVGEISAAWADVKKQLGFDPTTPEGISSAGLDPNGPVLVGQKADGSVVAVVTVGDDAKFDATVTRLMKDRLRSSARTEVNGVVLYSNAPGQPSSFGYLRVGKLAAFSNGPASQATLSAVKGRAREASLASDAVASQLIANSAEQDLAVYVPKTSTLATQVGLGQGVRVQAALRPHRAEVALDMPLSTAQTTLVASMQATAGQDLVAHLDSDAFLVGHTGVDPATLWPVLDTLTPAGFRQMLLNMGIRANEQLSNLKPGAAMSLAMPTTVDLSHMPSFDPRETNPFRYVYLAGLGRAKDVNLSKTALADVKKFGKDSGADIVESTQGNVPVYTFKYALGEGASIAFDGELVAVSGGEGRLPPLLTRLHAPPPTAGQSQGPVIPGDDAARFNGAGSAMYLDISKVVERMSALPASAYGLGGFAIQAAVARWLAALSEIHSILVTADYREQPSGELHVEVGAALP
jgi:hypothetical protein